MKKIIVTTSWDDGYKLDIKLSNLLSKYHLKGTFYLPQQYLSKSLNEKEIRVLAQEQEIGAHTLTHPQLNSISLAEAKKEIKGSKEYLENLLAQPVKVFAYPGGFFNHQIKEIVKEAKFLGARTTQRFTFQPPVDFFAFGVSHQVYPFPLRKRNAAQLHFSRFLFQPLQQNFFQILKLKLPWSAFFSWSNLIKGLFDYVRQNGGIWHLWGHTWEIERYQMWSDLEGVFRYIANQKNIAYLTNSQVLENL